jgi:hypothetical protein
LAGVISYLNASDIMFQQLEINPKPIS